MYIEDNRVGLWMSWYDNGKKNAEATYMVLNNDQVLNGYYNQWHTNGQLAERGLYKNGLPEGKWNAWYENGNKHMTAKFNTNGAGNMTLWNESGQQTLQTKFSDYDQFRTYFNN